MSAITSRSTKAQLLDHIATLECELRQSRKELEAQRLLTSIAEGNASLTQAAAVFTAAPTDEIEPGRFAPIDASDAPRPVRTFMQNGVLMHKVCIGFNRFAIRPVQVAA